MQLAHGIHQEFCKRSSPISCGDPSPVGRQASEFCTPRPRQSQPASSTQAPRLTYHAHGAHLVGRPGLYPHQ
eukprot:5467590-Amphidinium_carterae.1